MDEAAAFAPRITRPTWIMAHRQTGARGRQGRTWEMPEGNLGATLVYRPACTPAEAARRSFVAANALYAALAHFIDRDALALKWPNDVLLNGGKVAGILLESAGGGPFVERLSVGVGVNLATAPADTGQPFRPVSLADQGGEVPDPLDFLTILADCYATQESVLDRLGFRRVRDDWLSRAARLGEVITARTAERVVQGIFDTVDDEGNLVLITGSGPRAIPAAEVYF